MGFLHDCMRVREDLPRVKKIREWIPIEGVGRLAARIWLPEGEVGPFPALLEYLPYAKMTAERDEIRHTYLAAHVYASVRVDMRGSGDSDGILHDEYTQEELDDCLKVLAWLEAQPWCTGSCGMFGKSWGGFNALQVAALRPPQLKAIITIASTDDRYSDDIHYMGGCMLASEMLSWASFTLLYNSLPPDPLEVGDCWKDMWLQRAREVPPLVHEWLNHQRRDSYWKHGSVCEDYGAITCPVYVVGSYEDGYTNAVPRLLEHLSVPRKGLIGPWAHNFPEDSAPGPAVGFLQESVMWWDHWLKGVDNGVMNGPMLRSFVLDGGDAVQTDASLPRIRAGRWVADVSWPSPNVSVRATELVCEGLAKKQTPQACGVDSPKWLTFGDPVTDTPLQLRDNDCSILFLSPPLPEAQNAFGVPMSGEVRLVSWGLKNLNHGGRGCDEFPEELVPGEELCVDVGLKMSGYRIAAGHRWCISVSTTYWPHIWPSLEPVTLSVTTCTLLLPLRSPSTFDAGANSFWKAPECAPPLAVRVLRSGSSVRKRDEDGGKSRLTQCDDDDEIMLPCGLVMAEKATDTFEISQDPLSARTVSTRSKVLRRGTWSVRIETHSEMHSDGVSWLVSNRLQCWEGKGQEGEGEERDGGDGGDELVLDRDWHERIPRDLQ